MRRLASLALFAAVLATSAAPVPEPPPVVKGPLPIFLNLSQAKIDAKAVQGTRVEYRSVTKSVPVVTDVAGKKVTRIQTVTEMVPQTTSYSYPLDQYEILTAEGKTLSVETALPLLKSAAVVLVSEGALDPAIQKVLAKDALILVKKTSNPNP